MLEKFKYLNRKKGIKLLGVLVIALGIPVGVYLVSKIARFEAPAATDPVDVYLSPSSQTFPPDSLMRIMVNARTNSVIFTKVVFSFDRSLYNLKSDITTTSSMANVIQKTSMAEANAQGKVVIVLAVPPAQSATSGIFEYASFTIGPAGQNSSSSKIDFITSEMQVVDTNSTILTLQATSATLIYSTQISLTPTPAPSLTPTLTPIPPTSTPVSTTSCSVILNPQTISVNRGSVINLLASVTLYNSARVDRVVFTSENTAIALVNPASDAIGPYTTALRGVAWGSTTTRASVYLVGIATPACGDSSPVTVR